MKLDKSDLDAIAKNRVNKHRLVKQLYWSTLGLLILDFLIAGAITVWGCYYCLLERTTLWGILGLAVACVITLMVIWEKRRRRILKELESEYDTNTTHK